MIYMREIGEGQFGKVLLMKAKVTSLENRFTIDMYYYPTYRTFVVYKDQFLSQ